MRRRRRRRRKRRRKRKRKNEEEEKACLLFPSFFRSVCRGEFPSKAREAEQKRTPLSHFSPPRWRLCAGKRQRERGRESG